MDVVARSTSDANANVLVDFRQGRDSLRRLSLWPLRVDASAARNREGVFRSHAWVDVRGEIGSLIHVCTRRAVDDGEQPFCFRLGGWFAVGNCWRFHCKDWFLLLLLDKFFSWWVMFTWNLQRTNITSVLSRELLLQVLTSTLQTC